MEERIIEFAGVLRRNGIRVSLSENMDAFRALELIGIGDPLLFRNALRTTLVKRAGDLKPFDELFDFYFLGIGQALDALDRRIMEELGLTPEQFQDMLDQIQRLLKEMEGDLSELSKALLGNNRGELERLLREAMQQEIENGTPDSFRFTPYTRMAARLQLDRTQSEIERFKAMLQMLGETGEDLQKVMRYLDERMRDLNRLLREIIQQEQRKKGFEPRDSSQRSSLADKSFAFYTEDDIRRMNDAVARLAQRLKNRLSVRRKKATRGRFDVKKTLRKNLQYGGVPFNIQLDRRKKTKPQVMVLCDISDSVLNASRFMLQFVYSIQDLYTKVRSFVFVAEIGEVTKLFEENDIQTAVEAALKGDVIDVFSHSNFGRAFEQFYKNFFAAVNGKTTVLIIGDGRNNYNRPNDWVLREIQQKAKQLIWLNPESRMTWGIGDSEMPRYVPYCHVAEECRSINQLYKIVDLIVP
ncbi:MAG: VWA domain-containing protein [Deltaproteobacteria bacterium]|nr:MAG: VWA domain-containing protein [Deltaproteobacteria bacterium]